MDKINWKVRLKSPQFWTGIVSAIAIFVISFAALLGIDISDDANNVAQQVIAMIMAVFSMGAAVGVIADPTTQGMGDSLQAMAYSEPKPRRAATGSDESEE